MLDDLLSIGLFFELMKPVCRLVFAVAKFVFLCVLAPLFVLANVYVTNVADGAEKFDWQNIKANHTVLFSACVVTLGLWIGMLGSITILYITHWEFLGVVFEATSFGILPATLCLLFIGEPVRKMIYPHHITD